MLSFQVTSDEQEALQTRGGISNKTSPRQEKQPKLGMNTAVLFKSV